MRLYSWRIRRFVHSGHRCRFAAGRRDRFEAAQTSIDVRQHMMNGLMTICITSIFIPKQSSTAHISSVIMIIIVIMITLLTVPTIRISRRNRMYRLSICIHAASSLLHASIGVICFGTIDSHTATTTATTWFLILASSHCRSVWIVEIECICRLRLHRFSFVHG